MSTFRRLHVNGSAEGQAARRLMWTIVADLVLIGSVGHTPADSWMVPAAVVDFSTSARLPASWSSSQRPGRLTIWAERGHGIHPSGPFPEAWPGRAPYGAASINSARAPVLFAASGGSFPRFPAATSHRRWTGLLVHPSDCRGRARMPAPSAQMTKRDDGWWWSRVWRQDASWLLLAPLLTILSGRLGALQGPLRRVALCRLHRFS